MATTNIVTWTIDGVEYRVDLFDIDGLEWRDAKRASGMSQGEIVAAACQSADFEAIATLVWIWRRRNEPALQYETVLGGISYAALEAPVAPGGDADPPVDGQP